MINLLAEGIETASKFDTDTLYLILLILLPILFGLIASKTWNIVHGIITYILFSYIVLYLADLNVLVKIFENTDLVNNVLAANYPVNFMWGKLMDIEALNSMLNGDAAIHIMLAVHVVLFIISQIIGSILRKNR